MTSQTVLLESMTEGIVGNVIVIQVSDQESQVIMSVFSKLVHVIINNTGGRDTYEWRVGEYPAHSAFNGSR
jgi:hypothetical protein